MVKTKFTDLVGCSVPIEQTGLVTLCYLSLLRRSRAWSDQVFGPTLLSMAS